MDFRPIFVRLRFHVHEPSCPYRTISPPPHTPTPRCPQLAECYLLATADELGEVAGVDVDVVVLNGVVDILPDVVLLGL